jgi:hypothetical protein
MERLGSSRLLSRLAAVMLFSLLALDPVSGQTVAPGASGAAAPQSSQAPQDSAVTRDSTGKAIVPLDGKTMAVITPKSRADSVIVVKHDFNHREQIITGSVIMSCLMLMMVAMNNYNPR